MKLHSSILHAFAFYLNAIDDRCLGSRGRRWLRGRSLVRRAAGTPDSLVHTRQSNDLYPQRPNIFPRAAYSPGALAWAPDTVWCSQIGATFLLQFVFFWDDP
jgi:hypothetical protein